MKKRIFLTMVLLGEHPAGDRPGDPPGQGPGVEIGVPHDVHGPRVLKGPAMTMRAYRRALNLVTICRKPVRLLSALT